MAKSFKKFSLNEIFNFERAPCARYYDPTIGRFIQKDPHPGRKISSFSVVNKYIYTLNNPMKYRDPSGKDIWDEIGKVVTIGAAVAAGFYVGTAAIAYFGASGLAAYIVGFSAGAVAGGAVGAIGYSLSHADPRDGLRYGAIAGAVGGLMAASGIIETDFTVEARFNPKEFIKSLLSNVDNPNNVDLDVAAKVIAEDIGPFLSYTIPYLTPAAAIYSLDSADKCVASGQCPIVETEIFNKRVVF